METGFDSYSGDINRFVDWQNRPAFVLLFREAAAGCRGLPRVGRWMCVSGRLIETSRTV